MTSLAQDDRCTTIVLEALDLVEGVCSSFERNQVCYGNNQIDVEFFPDAAGSFESPGDVIELWSISRLHTGAYDPDSGAWGIALINAQADLPDTLPGQNVTFLLTGDVTLDTARDAGENSLQAFYFASGVGEVQCQNAPNSLVIQNPQGTQVNLTVNGVEIRLGSTVVLGITEEDSLEIILAAGEAEIAALGVSQPLLAGQTTTIPVDDSRAAAPPTAPEPYDPVRTQAIPFGLLPERIEVSVTVPWTDTGIMLHTGDQFTISASGLMNTHISAEGPYADFNLWVPPAGFPTDAACPVTSLGPDFVCRSSCSEAGLEGCLEGAPVMALIGRVGTGASFLVGAGGSFTANSDGMLQLEVYEGALEGYADNAGAFYALITLIEQSQ